MGIIVNKPLADLRIGELLSQLEIPNAENAPDQAVLNGGPVDRDRGFVVHTNDYSCEDTTMQISENLGLTATKEVLTAMAGPERPQFATLALGYAGWDGGQLEAELQDNAWLVVPATSALIFGEQSSKKWENALATIGVTPGHLSGMGGEA